VRVNIEKKSARQSNLLDLKKKTLLASHHEGTHKKPRVCFITYHPHFPFPIFCAILHIGRMPVCLTSQTTFKSMNAPSLKNTNSSLSSISHSRRTLERAKVSLLSFSSELSLCELAPSLRFAGSMTACTRLAGMSRPPLSKNRGATCSRGIMAVSMTTGRFQLSTFRVLLRG